MTHNNTLQSLSAGRFRITALYLSLRAESADELR